MQGKNSKNMPNQNYTNRNKQADIQKIIQELKRLNTNQDPHQRSYSRYHKSQLVQLDVFMNTPLCDTGINITIYPFNPSKTATIANKQDIKFHELGLSYGEKQLIHLTVTTDTYHFLPTSSNISVKMCLIAQ